MDTILHDSQTVPPITCPPWCTQHEVLDVTDDDGRLVERHLQWLYAQWVPACPERPSIAVYVIEASALSSGPGMSLRTFDGVPMALQPDQARRLAAALLKGAEIVEAARTATCPGCQRPVVPAELENRQECYWCEGDRRVAERASRRASMSVVRTAARVGAF
ncbi:MAG: hypothetical protein ACYDDW_05250 [Dermatophilaceae bacterium]